MVLNIFPRRERPAAAEAPTEIERQLPEPSPEALEEPKKTTRRGTRGGRGRRKPVETIERDDAPEALAPEAPPKPARASRAKPKPVEEPIVAAVADAPEAAPAPVAKRASNRKPAAEPAASDLAALVRVVEAQGRQLETLAKAQEQLLQRAASGPGGALPARVGVFVDSANVELAIDRLRTRVSWKKVLDLLTENRTLVRAIAYSPVHDDPGVSIETQRFAEPFLGKGYKVVTKPLKRFADGTIKANVDIEMACDIIEMLDRLDVVCLVSGDGDFQRLVEVIQAKGVRVEVVAVGTSTASSLRNAADQFTDLQGIIQKVKA